VFGDAFCVGLLEELRGYKLDPPCPSGDERRAADPLLHPLCPRCWEPLRLAQPLQGIGSLNKVYAFPIILASYSVLPYQFWWQNLITVWIRGFFVSFINLDWALDGLKDVCSPVANSMVKDGKGEKYLVSLLSFHDKPSSRRLPTCLVVRKGVSISQPETAWNKDERRFLEFFSFLRTLKLFGFRKAKNVLEKPEILTSP
jgi:hypothetical protein